MRTIRKFRFGSALMVSGALLALAPALLEAGGYRRSVNVHRNINVHRDFDIDVNRGWVRPAFGAGVVAGAVAGTVAGIAIGAAVTAPPRGYIPVFYMAGSIMLTTVATTISPPISPPRRDMLSWSHPSARFFRRFRRDRQQPRVRRRHTSFITTRITNRCWSMERPVTRSCACGAGISNPALPFWLLAVGSAW